MVVINDNQWKSAFDRDYHNHHQWRSKSLRRGCGFHDFFLSVVFMMPRTAIPRKRSSILRNLMHRQNSATKCKHHTHYNFKTVQFLYLYQQCDWLVFRKYFIRKGLLRPIVWDNHATSPKDPRSGRELIFARICQFIMSKSIQNRSLVVCKFINDPH